MEVYLRPLAGPQPCQSRVKRYGEAATADSRSATLMASMHTILSGEPARGTERVMDLGPPSSAQYVLSH